MPPPLSSRQRQPSGHPLALDANPSILAGDRLARRGGLNDSPERAPPPLGRAATREPPGDVLHYDTAPYDTPADGRGGLSGPQDPYDRPTRSQWLGAQSRLRQDKADGALDHVRQIYQLGLRPLNRTPRSSRR